MAVARLPAGVVKVAISTMYRAKRIGRACIAPVPSVAVAVCKDVLVLDFMTSYRVAGVVVSEIGRYKMGMVPMDGCFMARHVLVGLKPSLTR